MALLAIMVVEYLPSPIPAQRPPLPEYVRVLRDTPGAGAVYDVVTPAPLALYYQTLHGRPMAEGYVARLPISVVMRDMQQQRLFRLKRFSSLRNKYGFRFLVVPADLDVRSNVPDATLLYDSAQLRVFDAGPRS